MLASRVSDSISSVNFGQGLKGLGLGTSGGTLPLPREFIEARYAGHIPDALNM
jgi:hypothetical protein